MLLLCKSLCCVATSCSTRSETKWRNSLPRSDIASIQAMPTCPKGPMLAAVSFAHASNGDPSGDLSVMAHLSHRFPRTLRCRDRGDLDQGQAPRLRPSGLVAPLDPPQGAEPPDRAHF